MDMQFFPSAAPEVAPALLESCQSEWQLVEIYQHPVFGNQLWIDRDLQISESDLAYNTAMTAPLLTLPACRRVAILGGGDGGVMNTLLQQADLLTRELAEVTLIDIDEAVIELSKTHLPRLCGEAFTDPRSNVIVGDAFGWVKEARELDAVIYDLTMEPVNEHTTRAEFMADILTSIHRSLRPGGVISLQACGASQPDRARWLGDLKDQLTVHFGPVYEQEVMVPSYGELWTFLSGTRR